MRKALILNGSGKNLVKESGDEFPRALALSSLEFLVSIERVTYTNRKTEKGVIRDYRVE
jgi:hypothetical protein